MRRVPTSIPVLIIAAWATTAVAHDFWIEPSTWRPRRSEPIKVALRVGMNFAGEPVLRDSNRIARFVAVGPEGETPILGFDGRDPAGVLSPEQAGLHILAYRSNNARVELEPAKFEQYLKEEGLERIITVRRERGDASKVGREVYSRCAKCLLFVAPAENEKDDQPGPAASGVERAVGLTLELIPECNPLTLKPGGELPVRLMFEGKPLEGVLVAALSKEDAKQPISGRTDSAGRVKLKLPRGGVWLIKAVHMTPAPPGADADWQSVWASLTFEAGGRK